MSYATARAQLVRIVEGAGPLSPALGLGSRFVHVPEATQGAPVMSRGFLLASVDMAILGPLTSGTRRYSRGIDLAVFYPDVSDVAKLDEVMAADHAAIADALLDVTKWDRPASGIVAISTGSDLILSADVVPEEAGRWLIIRFPLEHT
jgi:hypothetical protein